MVYQRSIEKLPFDGGWLCLDFVNTVHDRTIPNPHEYLSSYSELLKWILKAQALSKTDIAKLKTLSEKDAQESEAILAEVIKARELLHKIFMAIANGELPENGSIKAFNALLTQSLPHTALEFLDPYNIERQWKQIRELESPLYPIMQSAYDLLLSDKLNRVKECGGCGWLFLDKSKNNSRRWCDMQSCGSAVKAKKYYRRKKQGH